MAEKKTTKKSNVFDMSLVKKIDSGNATGSEYYDKFTRYRSSVATRVVDVAPEKLFSLMYAKRPLKDQEVRDKKTDLSKLEPPIIDIIKKKGSGCGRTVVAHNKKLKKIPVVILADREGQIDWYLDKKGIK